MEEEKSEDTTSRHDEMEFLSGTDEMEFGNNSERLDTQNDELDPLLISGGTEMTTPTGTKRKQPIGASKFSQMVEDLMNENKIPHYGNFNKSDTFKVV